MSRVTLTQYLVEQHRAKNNAPAEVRQLIEDVGRACKGIASAINKGALAGVLGGAGTDNVQGEAQKKLDVISNDMIVAATEWGGYLAGMASEEMDNALPIPAHLPKGDYLLVYDPLDGSSNIDVNVSVGTIFSVLRCPQGVSAADEKAYLQPGKQQIAAGFVVYGPATIMVLTVGNGATAFTLDRDAGDWIQTTEKIAIPADTKEFAINTSNARNWTPPIKRYIDECLAGAQGPRGKDFNMRWVASMVADVFRIISRGGIFMYPVDAKHTGGRLRLLYEANPMSFIVEQAGGAAINGPQRILDVQPGKLHQRQGVILGSKNEVELVGKYYAEMK